MVKLLLSFLLLLAYVSADPPTGALQPDDDKTPKERTRGGGPPEWAAEKGRKLGRAIWGEINPSPFVPPGWEHAPRRNGAEPVNEKLIVGADLNGDEWEVEVDDPNDNEVGHGKGALLETARKDEYFFNIAPASGGVNEAIWPNNLVGYLSMGCTGTQIGPRVVATAAHCLYTAETRAWQSVPDLFWKPGRPSATGTFWAQDIWISYEFHNFLSYNPRYDWGVVVLKTPNNNFLSFASRTPLPATLLHQGYPDIKKPDQWKDSCAPYLDDGVNFFHKCDINPGSSGGPMFDPNYVLIGVQSGHYADGSQGNIGYKYSPAVVADLVRIRAENP
jgi:hypothetical protein